MTTDRTTPPHEVLVGTDEVSAARDLVCRDLVYAADGRRTTSDTWRSDDPSRLGASMLDALAEYITSLPLTDHRLAHLAHSIRGHDPAWPVVIGLDALVNPMLGQSEIDLDRMVSRVLLTRNRPEARKWTQADSDAMTAMADRIVGSVEDASGTLPSLTGEEGQ